MIPIHPEHGHMIIATSIAALAFIADAIVGDLSSVESMTFKGALIVAIIYLVRQNTLQREKSDASAIEREKAMATALHATAEGLKDLKSSTDTQTGYFKTVAQTIINREVHPKLPNDQ